MSSSTPDDFYDWLEAERLEKRSQRFGAFALIAATIAVLVLLAGQLFAQSPETLDAIRQRQERLDRLWVEQDRLMAECKAILDKTLADTRDIHEVILQRSNQGVWGESDPAQYRPVCQVAVGGGSGSGTLVAPQVVLTAAHVVGGSKQAALYWPAYGYRVMGQVYRVDAYYDLAVVLIPRQTVITPCRVATVEPIVNEPVTVAGFGGHPRKGFFATIGRLLRGGQRQKTISVPVSKGDSGGPAFNERGEVVGVNSTSDLQHVVNCSGSVERINEMVAACDSAAGQGTAQQASGFG